MGIKYTFTDYRQQIAFLQEIPASVASQLSLDEFYFPDKEVEQARKELEAAFDHYVMTYQADKFNQDAALVTHLCANYKGALLTEEQKQLLTVYEMRLQHKNVRFVVYKKPLTKISIQESPFFN